MILVHFEDSFLILSSSSSYPAKITILGKMFYFDFFASIEVVVVVDAN